MMLIFMLVAFSLLALLCFYWVWWRPDPSSFVRSRALAGFMISAFGFIPVILGMMWAQATASKRLRAEGVEPHPAIVSPSGLAVGFAGESQTWVFELSRPGIDTLDFYRDPEHVRGWELLVDESVLLQFEREDRRLMISAGPEPLLFIMMNPKKKRAIDR